MSPGLDGTGWVADDLYLLAHNDVTGRPYIQPRPLGLGLAGGLLAELILAGAVSLSEDLITVIADLHRRSDGLTHRVLGLLAGEREAHTMRDWLVFLARTAVADVASRLAAAGYLARAGGLWRGRRWVP